MKQLTLVTTAALAFWSPLSAADLSLGKVVQCNLGSDCYIQQYVDHDVTSLASDYRCKGLSYDGHKGTDFAAPSGTPIMASGSGTVTRARWCGGGGNCVKIKHNSTYETVYAHMKSFAKGVKEGKKVKQGQIIGYVGSTGLSTGPHLHYEVIVNGKKVNSQRLKLPSGKILKGESRKEFEIERIKIDLRLSELR